VHAKDTRIDPANAAVNSLIDTVPSQQVRDRTWGYVTLGLWARRGLVARVLPGAEARPLRRCAVDRARGPAADARGKRAPFRESAADGDGVIVAPPFAFQFPLKYC
jgi:hypothetical protein